MGLISRVSSRTYRTMASEDENYLPDNVNIINFDENEKAGSDDENADYLENEFARMKDFEGDSDNEEEEDPENPESENIPKIDQIAAGGIFSESSDINSTIASEFTGSNANFTQSHCGTSILGDSIYTPKEKSDSQKFKVPETPDLTAIKNKSRKRQLYAEFLKEKKKSEKKKSAARREKRMNETDEERA